MKLQFVSDLHLEFLPQIPGIRRGSIPFGPENLTGNLLILAGDIHTDPEALAAFVLRLKASTEFPVVLVLGNHEFYDRDWTDAIEEYRDAMEQAGAIFLENGTFECRGVRFLGCTLWSDFAGGTQAAACTRYLRDFVAIRNKGKAIIPGDVAGRFRNSLEWLGKSLDTPFPGDNVVITHHAPSFRSVSPRFAGSPLNGGFVSDLDGFIASHPIRIWIHGHTHDSFDYRIGATRILANPFGYPGRIRNPMFDPGMVVEVG